MDKILIVIKGNEELSQSQIDTITEIFNKDVVSVMDLIDMLLDKNDQLNSETNKNNDEDNLDDVWADIEVQMHYGN